MDHPSIDLDLRAVVGLGVDRLVVAVVPLLIVDAAEQGWKVEQVVGRV